MIVPIVTSMKTFNERLADAVRERRAALDLTQQDLADLAGCSPRFLGALEAGKPSLRLDKLLGVLDALGLDLRVARRG